MPTSGARRDLWLGGICEVVTALVEGRTDRRGALMTLSAMGYDSLADCLACDPDAFDADVLLELFGEGGRDGRLS